MIKGIPAVLYGEDAEKGYLFVHGQGGNKEEAAAPELRAILYAERDDMTAMETVRAFADPHAAALTICRQGEHWFHTPRQLKSLRTWEMSNVL